MSLAGCCTGDSQYDQSTLVSDELDEDVVVGSSLVSSSVKVSTSLT